MKSFKINHVSTATNEGIAREHDLCAYMGINRTTHDNNDYRTASDIIVNDRHISVKSSGFTLMNGTLCENAETLEEIWNVYKETTNATEIAYITTDYTVYMMSITEFEKFVKTFCRTEKDSKKNGGKMKVRCRHESEKMRQWLALAL